MGTRKYKNYRTTSKEQPRDSSYNPSSERYSKKRKSNFSYGDYRQPDMSDETLGGAAGTATYTQNDSSILVSDSYYRNGLNQSLVKQTLDYSIKNDIVSKPFDKIIQEDILKPADRGIIRYSRTCNKNSLENIGVIRQVARVSPNHNVYGSRPTLYNSALTHGYRKITVSGYGSAAVGSAKSRVVSGYSVEGKPTRDIKINNREIENKSGNISNIYLNKTRRGPNSGSRPGNAKSNEKNEYTQSEANSTHARSRNGYRKGDAVINSSMRAFSRALQQNLLYKEETMAERAGRTAVRPAANVGKYSALAGVAVVRGSVNAIRYTASLSKKVRLNTITAKDAKYKALQRAKNSFAESGRSVKKIVKKELVKGVINFRGSDDLGMQTVVKTKDAYFKAKRVSRGVKRTKRAIKSTAHMTKRGIQRTAQAAKYVGRIAKAILLNPVVIKSGLTLLGIVSVVFGLITVVSSVSSMVPPTTLKSSDEDLTKTYRHITDMDAKLTKEIHDIPDRPENQDIDHFHFIVNGSETSLGNIYFITNADSILAYYDVKYNDYAFENRLIPGVFGGGDVKSDLEGLHKRLYSYDTYRWEEEVTTETTTTNENGEEVTTTTTETIYHLDINIRAIDFDTFLSQNESELLTSDEKERLEALNEVGVYTSKKDLGKPFEGEESTVTLRFGWYFNPTDKTVKDHEGVDIAKPEGTSVLCVLTGTIKEASGDKVTIEQGKRQVTYKNLGSVSVSSGQSVKIGDTIGTVGAAGSGDISTAHVHIEYRYNNFTLCPSIYLDGVITDTSGMNYGEIFNPGTPGGWPGGPGGWPGGPGGPFPTGPGNGSIVAMAASQIGNVGGRPYWSYYGFKNRTAWCAIFVSWCKEMCGQNGAFPTFYKCTVGAQWFVSNGLMQYPGSGYIPRPGDIIFFDFSARWGRGLQGTDHVAIVESCDGQYVYTIEGNTKNSVARRKYPLNRASIVGYGTPRYK